MTNFHFRIHERIKVEVAENDRDPNALEAWESVTQYLCLKLTEKDETLQSPQSNSSFLHLEPPDLKRPVKEDSASSSVEPVFQVNTDLDSLATIASIMESVTPIDQPKGVASSLNVKSEPRKKKKVVKSELGDNGFENRLGGDVKFSNCVHCPETFFSDIELFNHVAAQHQNSKFTCPVCGKVLSSVKTFKTHVDIHSYVEKYGCSICGKTFKQNSSLYRHMLTHQQPKFACKFCDRKFRRKCYLVDHERVHADGGSILLG